MTVFPGGIRHLHIETVDSTNLFARVHLEHGTVITAARQTAGRGRYGRDWTSPEGNLYLSLVWRVRDFDDAGKYAFLSAVALAAALKAAVGDNDLPLQLKWPNDVLLGGKKLCGILLEAETKADQLYLIIGVGVNLVHAPDYACDLKSATGKTVTPQETAQHFSAAFAAWDARFKTEGFDAVRESWLSQAHDIGTAIAVKLPQENFNGTFAGIDKSGALLLEQQNGTLRTVTSGEVFFT
jgi:BirA family biotin operon repressor/biotin-[acetyl-CoA-carboxylase] ligase